MVSDLVLCDGPRLLGSLSTQQAELQRHLGTQRPQQAGLLAAETHECAAPRGWHGGLGLARLASTASPEPAVVQRSPELQHTPASPPSTSSSTSTADGDLDILFNEYLHLLASHDPPFVPHDKARYFQLFHEQMQQELGAAQLGALRRLKELHTHGQFGKGYAHQKSLKPLAAQWMHALGHLLEEELVKVSRL